MKVYKIFGLVLAPIAVLTFLLGTIGIFGTGIALMYGVKSYRHTPLGAWIWRRLEGIGWLWTSVMWGASLIFFMWIRRRVIGSYPPLPAGTQLITSGNHASYIAMLGSAYQTTVLNRTPLKIIGKVENKKHLVNGFLLRAAELLGWVILIDRSDPESARQAIFGGVNAIAQSVNYLLYLDKHRFTKKRRQKDIEKFASRIPRIQDFTETLVPHSGGLWKILTKLREHGIPVQVVDTTICFNTKDLGFLSLFRIFGSVLHIEIRDISAEIAGISTEEELQIYLVELYRAKNRRMREIRGIPHPA